MRQNFTKGSHFWPLAHQNLKRVRIFYENSQKGSHFRIRQCRKTRKGSHFWTRLWQQFQKVRICGYFLERVRIFYIFQLGRKWFAVFDHKRHKAKTLKIRRPFLLHSAFINSSRKCIFLVDRVVEHFWCKFW